MKYEIFVNDYELDENGTVVDRDGGSLIFNDADDFIMMWNYFKGSAPVKKITDNGEYLLMEPKEIGHYVTDYQITGDAYKIWKKRFTENNKEINSI